VLQVASLLGIIWMVNLYNFMDGMDGFAASMAIIGLGSLSLAALSAGATTYPLAGALVVVAVAGFAVWNLPPARIFMGDIGSTFLGLLAAVFGLAGIAAGYFPLWVPALVFSPFWVDATYTLAKRIARREAFWQAHRSHFYQRLVLKTGSHRRVLVAELLLMLACAVSAVLPALCGLGYNELIPLIWLGFYIGLIVVLEIRLANEK
jgi:UDP-N-acetylmuramyl pentapeptide phosphotransferase/UDP-N-acetylglucosamine-1-phosphate transferase